MKRFFYNLLYDSASTKTFLDGAPVTIPEGIGMHDTSFPVFKSDHEPHIRDGINETFNSLAKKDTYNGYVRIPDKYNKY